MTNLQRLTIRQLGRNASKAKRQLKHPRYEVRLRAEGRYKAYQKAIQLMGGKVE